MQLNIPALKASFEIFFGHYSTIQITVRGWESEVRIAKKYSTKKAHLSTQWNQIVL